MGFRCTAIVGNQNGLVGVGCMAGRDVAMAAKRALVDAKKNIVRVRSQGLNLYFVKHAHDDLLWLMLVFSPAGSPGWCEHYSPQD